MTITKTWLLAVAVICAAGLSASAAEINWNADPAAGALAQIRQESAKTVPVVLAREARTPVQTPEFRIEAQAVDSNVLAYEDSGDAEVGDEQITLNLNDAKDRMGALFSDCSTTYDDDSMPESCDTLQFVFPGLTVSKADHTVRKGGELVATWSSHFMLGTHVKLVNGYRLSVHKDKKIVTVDDGFDHHQETRTTLSIALVKN